jgi:TonB-linked SusC/RagA family outer membrane protein
MMRWLLLLGVGALAALDASRLKAQSAVGRVTGTVTGESGVPIVGARVVILTTRIAVATNAEGRYTILAPPGQYQVRASMLGYEPIIDSVSVTDGQPATIDFHLKRSAIQLTEMVVVGYGTQQRRDVTGAEASVSADEIRQTPTTNAVEAIKGRMPGVDIVATGFKPGDGVRVRVRGQRSIKASNDPLYVLDGIPMAGSIGDLNPADIESMEVLKDASATAIYGSRGANGVVLITSRHGIAGNTRVTFDSYAAAEQPTKKMRVFNGPEFADYKREAYRASGDYYKFCPDGNPCDAGDKATFYAEEYAALQQGISTDWLGLISRTGSQLSNQLSISGGNDRTQYALSGNVIRDNGIILGQNYDRKSMRVNIETQANARLRFGGSALVLRSTQDLGRSDGLYGEALADAPLAQAHDSTGAVIFKPTPDPQRDNPLSDAAHWFDQRQRTRAFGALFAQASLADGLDYRVNFGPDISYQRRGLFHGAQTQVNQGTGADGSLWNDRTFDYTLDNILTYRRGFGTNHRIDATFLYGIQKETVESDSSKSSGLPYETQLYWNLGSGSTVEYINSGISQWALQSYMARLNYSFRDRYLLTATTRVDGSSRLAPGRKYATFPSVALAWRAIDRSAFGNGFGPLENLKVRASYGRTGNTSVSPYQTEGSLARSIYSWGNNGAFGYRPGELPNPDLRWETTSQYDAGVDFSLLHNRLSGTIDGYFARTTDLLMDRKLPPNTGYTQITQNIGSTRNKGIEVALSHLTLDGWHGIRWSNDATFSIARNEIVSLTYGKKDDPGNQWFIGQPIDGGGNNVWYDYRFLGIWQTADSAEAAKFGEKPGMIRVEDISGPDGVPDGKINSYDLQILGNTYPRWSGSFNTRADWKMFDVEAQVITRQGFMVQNLFRTDNSTLAGRYNGIKVDYWTPSNPSNTDPRPNKNQESPVYGGTRAYEDGSFTRIRNITVGVTVPQPLVRHLGAETVRLYGTAQNPFTFTRFTGLDPEGRNSAGTPAYRMFLMGATFGF